MTDKDIEMSRQDNLSFEAKLSARMSQVNDSILDNIVSRFSFVNDHHVRGKWRIGLSFAVVAVPIVIFCVAMWYQLMKACIANCQYYPLIEAPTIEGTEVAYSTQSTIRDFLAQDSIHYCASAVSSVTLMYDTDNVTVIDATTDWAPCKIQNHDTSSTGACSSYKDLGKVVSGYNNGYCFTEGNVAESGNVAVFYTQCIPITTALVNSIQASMYSIATTIVLYLVSRILAKHGVMGLISPSKWLEMLNNSKKDWKPLEDMN